METVQKVDVRELPILGGHLALNFANTVDDPDGPARHDHIATYAGLVRWSARVELLSPAQGRKLARVDSRRAAATVRQAHEVRALLNDLFVDVVAGKRSLDRHWKALRPLVGQALAAAVLEPSGASYRYRWPGEDPGVMLWPVVHAAADLLTSPELGRVKQCGNCPWLFLDQSKNGSRRWCSMEDCGTHAKIQRYVERRAARRAADRARE